MLFIRNFNDAIKNNFLEIIDKTLYSAAKKIIYDKLLRSPVINNNNKNIKDLLINLIIEKNQKKNSIINYYYLNENYANGEPINIIPCINNDVRIIKLLLKNKTFNITEYQDLIFRLGMKNILKTINKNNEITKINLEQYLYKHKKQFNDNIDFMNQQLFNNLKQNELEFFNISITSIIDFKGSIDNTTINTDPNLGPTNNILNLKELYNDLTTTQENTNNYLKNNIYENLKNVFDDNIIPSMKEFLKFYTKSSSIFILENIDTTNNQVLLLIDQIIYYFLGIDPSKVKDNSPSIDNIIDSFINLFIARIDDAVLKTNIATILNNKLKNKLTQFVMIISKYYLNIYQNYLRYLFNRYRYERLDLVL